MVLRDTVSHTSSHSLTHSLTCFLSAHIPVKCQLSSLFAAATACCTPSRRAVPRAARSLACLHAALGVVSTGWIRGDIFLISDAFAYTRTHTLALAHSYRSPTTRQRSRLWKPSLETARTNAKRNLCLKPCLGACRRLFLANSLLTSLSVFSLSLSSHIVQSASTLPEKLARKILFGYLRKQLSSAKRASTMSQAQLAYHLRVVRYASVALANAAASRQLSKFRVSKRRSSVTLLFSHFFIPFHRKSPLFGEYSRLEAALRDLLTNESLLSSQHSMATFAPAIEATLQVATSDLQGAAASSHVALTTIPNVLARLLRDLQRRSASEDVLMLEEELRLLHSLCEALPNIRPAAPLSVRARVAAAVLVFLDRWAKNERASEQV